jgi:hypothetical protein
MKLAALSMIAGAGCATAFTQMASSSTSSALHMSFENELGAQKPLGFWDPLNFVYQQDQERFDRLRAVELKHGRVSMLAVVGHMYTTAGGRLPGTIDMKGTTFASIKTGLAGLKDIPPAGLLQIIAFVGVLELNVMKDVLGTGEFDGDFRNGFDFGIFSWDNYSEEEKLKKRAIELNNGRAAQMGILALMVHEKLSGDPYIINTLLGYPSGFNQGL